MCCGVGLSSTSKCCREEPSWQLAHHPRSHLSDPLPGDFQTFQHIPCHNVTTIILSSRILKWGHNLHLSLFSFLNSIFYLLSPKTANIFFPVSIFNNRYALPFHWENWDSQRRCNANVPMGTLEELSHEQSTPPQDRGGPKGKGRCCQTSCPHFERTISWKLSFDLQTQIQLSIHTISYHHPPK